jgi:glycosyltransferase involved in cell wall biosynthesis
MEPSAEPKPESNSVTFSVIGSYIPTKGIDVLIKAFKNVSSSNIRLNIFGPDDIAPVYTNELRQLAIGDARIRFMGTFPPDQRERIYQDTDALVVPSLFPETYSLVSREALSLGKPVIASRIGALPEVIIDGINGFLFEPGSVHQLASILQRIANNPKILSELSCPGPVQIISMDNHIDKVLKIYDEVLSGDLPRVLSP